MISHNHNLTKEAKPRMAQISQLARIRRRQSTVLETALSSSAESVKSVVRLLLLPQEFANRF